MKLCIIGGGSKDKSALYLYEESKKFKEISKSLLVSLPKLYVEGYERVVYRNKDITNYDFCILHVLNNAFPFNYIVANILKNRGVILTHKPKAYLYVNKLFLPKVFNKAKVKYPKTYLTIAPEVSKYIVDEFDKLVFKLMDVHSGKGVIVLKDKSAADAIIDTLHRTSKHFCMQEVIEGEVIKLLVVGKEVIGVKETPKPDEMRSNIFQKRTFFKPSNELSKIGRRVARALGALYCEVDVIGEGEYYAIDISVHPNLLMYKELSGRNIAKILLNSLLEKKERVERWKRILWRKIIRPFHYI